MKDVAVVELFKEKLARGEEELLPSEIVDRLLDGENPIKVWREYRGFTIDELAAKIGSTASRLSEIENDKELFDTLKKIARDLNLTV